MTIGISVSRDQLLAVVLILQAGDDSRHLGTVLVGAWDRINAPRIEPMRGMKKPLAEHLRAMA